MYGSNDHPITEHELNRSIAGWLSAGYFILYLRHLRINGAKLPSGFWFWIVTTFVMFPSAMALWIFLVAGKSESDAVSNVTAWSTVIWFIWLVGGGLAMFRNMDHQVYANQVVYQQQAQFYEQAVRDAERITTAKATGDAVVDGLRQAYKETQQAPQPPQKPAQASQTRRNVIDVPALPPGPQSPTGPSQRPTPPPPEPPAPMGTSTPTLWVPTYSGPAKPVQRRETTLGGITISDRRGVDPDDL